MNVKKLSIFKGYKTKIICNVVEDHEKDIKIQAAFAWERANYTVKIKIKLLFPFVMSITYVFCNAG